MKRFAIAAVLLASIALPVSATEVWQGDLFITAATSQCAVANFDVGNFFRAVYHPPTIGGNDPDARLSLIGARNAARISRDNGAFVANGPYHGNFLSSHAGLNAWDSTLGAVSITAVTATSPRADIRLGVKNFADKQDAPSRCRAALPTGRIR